MKRGVLQKKLIKSGSKLFVGGVFVLTAACSGNLFSSFANSTTDAALLFEAKQALDQGEYGDAIDFIEEMTAAGQAERDVIAVKASAFAGRCGFTFLDFVDNISDAGTSRFFQILMQSMPSSTTAKKADCILAGNQLLTISADASGRTSDENLLMALVSLATLGAIFNTSLDTNNDGTVDSYDHCSTTALSSSDAKQVVASLASALSSLSAVGSSSVASGDMDSLESVCTSLAAVDANFNFCSITDVNNVTADHERAIRGVIGSDKTIGLGGSTNGSCTTGTDEATCAAACP